MEEYKANFEAERRDRVSMKERKDELAEELTRLRLELENKSAELEKLHQTHLRLAKEHVERYYKMIYYFVLSLRRSSEFRVIVGSCNILYLIN